MHNIITLLFLKLNMVQHLTAPALSRFSRELALEENPSKRLMGERRAKATMFSQQPRSGSRWEKESQRAIFPILNIHESTKQINPTGNLTITGSINNDRGRYLVTYYFFVRNIISLDHSCY
jgi:hypothetical protein